MLDKWQAIHAFWSSFGLPAYDENSVPDNAELPYITYSASVGGFEQVLVLTGSIWYRSMSWAGISQMQTHIAEMISPYQVLPVEGGYLYVSKGTTFAQRMGDEDTSIKRIYLVLNAEFFTDY